MTIFSDEVLMLTAAEMEEWYEHELILRGEQELRRQIITRGGRTRTLPLGSFFLLDNLQAKSVLGYSSRKLSSTFAGNAFNVRRSNDNATQDIGFTVSSDFLTVNLDTSSLASFVGNNSGFVTQFYDQTGNVNVSTQTTPANQPRVVNAGANETVNGRVAMHHLGTFLNYVSGTISAPYTICFVGQQTVLGNQFFDSNGTRIIFGPGGGNTWSLNAGGGYSGGSDDTNLHGFILTVVSGASSQIIVDGTQIATGNSGTFSWTSGEFIGAGFGPTGMTGFIAEVFILTSVPSTIDINTIEASWRSYWGTP